MTYLLRPIFGLMLCLVAAFAFAVSAEGQYLSPQPFSFGPQTKGARTTAAVTTFTATPWWLTPNSNAYGPTAASSLNSSPHSSNHSSSLPAVLPRLSGPFAYGPPCYGTTISGGMLQLGSTFSPYDGGTICLTASNTYTGNTAVQGGTLSVGSTTNLGGGVLSLPNSISDDLWSMLDTGCGGTTITSGMLNLGDGGIITEIGSGGTAVSAGSLALSGTCATISGAGTLVLTGSNCYSRGTFVNGGTMIVTGNQALADGTSLTVGEQSVFMPVVPSAVAASSFSGTLDSGFTPAIADGSSLTVGDGAAFSVHQSPLAQVLAISPVPEPGTLALLALAAGTILVCPRPLRLFAQSDR